VLKEIEKIGLRQQCKIYSIEDTGYQLTNFYEMSSYIIDLPVGSNFFSPTLIKGNIMEDKKSTDLFGLAPCFRMVSNFESILSVRCCENI